MIDDQTSQPQDNKMDDFVETGLIKTDSELTYDELCIRWTLQHPLANLATIYLGMFLTGLMTPGLMLLHHLLNTRAVSPWLMLLMPTSIVLVCIQQKLLERRARRYTREQLMSRITESREIINESPF